MSMLLNDPELPDVPEDYCFGCKTRGHEVIIGDKGLCQMCFDAWPGKRIAAPPELPDGYGQDCWVNWVWHGYVD